MNFFLYSTSYFGGDARNSSCLHWDESSTDLGILPSSHSAKSLGENSLSGDSTSINLNG
jgi:hypothetical protein